jgi:hypothetical protein
LREFVASRTLMRVAEMKKIAQVGAVACLISIIVLGFAIYAYSIYLASFSGWIATVLTIALPLIAQIYWIAVDFAATGVLLNTLLVACLAWIALFLTGLTLAALAER